MREHAGTLFAEARERSEAGYGYAAHVDDEFRRYIDCGLLSRGFFAGPLQRLALGCPRPRANGWRHERFAGIALQAEQLRRQIE